MILKETCQENEAFKSAEAQYQNHKTPNKQIEINNGFNHLNHFTDENFLQVSPFKIFQKPNQFNNISKYVMRSAKDLKKNKNTSKFMLHAFFRRHRQNKFINKLDPSTRSRFLNKVKRYMKKYLLLKKRDQLGLQDYRNFFKSEFQDELSFECRKIFAEIALDQSRLVYHNNKILNKKQYMLTLKVQALRSRNPHLISRLQIR